MLELIKDAAFSLATARANLTYVDEEHPMYEQLTGSSERLGDRMNSVYKFFKENCLCRSPGKT